MSEPLRAHLWAIFAAAAMGTGDAAENTALAAKAADRMIAGTRIGRSSASASSAAARSVRARR